MNDRRVNYNIARSRTSRLADVVLDLGFWVDADGMARRMSIRASYRKPNATAKRTSVRTEQQLKT